VPADTAAYAHYLIGNHSFPIAAATKYYCTVTISSGDTLGCGSAIVRIINGFFTVCTKIDNPVPFFMQMSLNSLFHFKTGMIRPKSNFLHDKVPFLLEVETH